MSEDLEAAARAIAERRLARESARAAYLARPVPPLPTLDDHCRALGIERPAPMRRTIRARPSQPLAEALTILINRGWFHGSQLPIRVAGADAVAGSERALQRAGAAGLIVRGQYEPSRAQRCFGLGGFDGNKLVNLPEQHRSALAYHWAAATTRWLEFAEVEAVLAP